MAGTMVNVAAEVDVRNHCTESAKCRKCSLRVPDCCCSVDTLEIVGENVFEKLKPGVFLVPQYSTKLVLFDAEDPSLITVPQSLHSHLKSAVVLASGMVSLPMDRFRHFKRLKTQRFIKTPFSATGSS